MAAAVSAIGHRSTAADWRSASCNLVRVPLIRLFEMLVGFNIWLDDDATELRVAWPIGFIQTTAAALATAQVICRSGGLLTGLSSLISGFPKNISVPTYPKSILELFASHPTRGAYRDRHGRGEGCGGRGSVRRATWLQGGLAKGL
jgi:hypothetical protein